MDKGAEDYHKFLKGDEDALVDIIRDYSEGLTLYLYRFTNDINMAEDFTEDTFFKLYTKRPRFSGKSSFKTWLYTIGRHLTLNKLRRRHFVSDVSLDECQNFADNTDIESSYIKSEQKKVIHNAMYNLKSEYRQVLHLVYIEGFSTEETAKIMHKTSKQIGNLLYRAKKSLRSELGKVGIYSEEL